MSGKKGVAEVNNVFEVESILGVKKVKNSVLYLVKWKNYPDTENTWEPEINLSGAQKILRDFKSRKQVLDAKDIKIENAFINNSGEILFAVKKGNKTGIFSRKELVETGHKDQIIIFYEELISINDNKKMK